MSLKLRSFLKPTPSEAISRLAANDANLTVVDLSNSAVMQLKGAELMPMLADALCTNTVCQARADAHGIYGRSAAHHTPNLPVDMQTHKHRSLRTSARAHRCVHASARGRLCTLILLAAVALQAVSCRRV
eukprot:6207623-Pleurochrysis_carterae.AAC.1